LVAAKGLYPFGIHSTKYDELAAMMIRMSISMKYSCTYNVGGRRWEGVTVRQIDVRR